MDELKNLRRKLMLREKELEIISRIDQIRDQESEPEAIFLAISRLLAEAVSGDFCLIYVIDPATGKVETRVCYDPEGMFTQLDSQFDAKVLGHALSLRQIEVVDITLHMQEDSSSVLPMPLKLAVVPIILGVDLHLGLFIVGKQAAFNTDEIELLKTAEDHVDSAVIQSLISFRHQQNMHEVLLSRRILKTITALDEIRDASYEPSDLYSALVQLFVNEFSADISLLFIRDRETGTSELKAVSDRVARLGELRSVITQSLVEEAVKNSQIKVWNQMGYGYASSLTELPKGVELLALPIVMDRDSVLGLLFLARYNQPFTQEELDILKKVEDHIDSALFQADFYQRHRQILDEVKAIYQIDHLRDQNITLDDLLNRVIEFLINHIPAEMGFIMLYDRAGQKLELRATSHQNLFHSWKNSDAFEQSVQEALQQGRLINKKDLSGAIHSVICLPLILNEQIIGVLGMVNHLEGNFRSFDCRLLQAVGSQIDTAIYERQEIRILRQVLGRSVDPRVMDRLLANPSVDVLKPERSELTVLFADIRGSTALAERTEPDILVEFIKDFLMQMTEVIFMYEGTVDKFVGDEVVALFGAPIPQSDHPLRAVRVGLAMQERHRQIMQAWQARGVAAPPIGIGIVTGRMIVGEMGGSARSNYTVIGREVNLGSRICASAEGGQILISEATYHQIRDLVVAKPLPPQRFKGVDRDVTVYDVIRLKV